MATVKAFVGGVGQLVAQNATRCKENIEQQQFLCVQDKERIAQMLVRKPLCLQTLSILSSECV